MVIYTDPGQEELQTPRKGLASVLCKKMDELLGELGAFFLVSVFRCHHHSKNFCSTVVDISVVVLAVSLVTSIAIENPSQE